MRLADLKTSSNCPRRELVRTRMEGMPGLVAPRGVLLVSKCERHHVAAKAVADRDGIDRLAS